MTALVIAAWRAGGRSFGELGLHSHLGLWDYAGFALAAFVCVAMPAQSMRLKSAPREAVEKALDTVQQVKITPDTGGQLALFILVSMTAGVWEELVFRGFLIWFLTPYAGPLGAVVGSALIFGAGHLYQGARGVATTTIIGLILGAAYLVSGSLWWVMAVHAAMDIGGGILSLRIKRLAARLG